MFPGNPQVAGCRTGGENNDAGLKFLVINPHLFRVPREIHLGDQLGAQVGAEPFRLVPHCLHEVWSHNAVREAGEILHLSGGHERATVFVSLKDQGF